MALLSDNHAATQPTTTDNPRPTETLGAQAPTTDYNIRRRPQPKPEPWRPQSAGRIALRPDRQLLEDLRIECLKEGITLTHWFELQALDWLRSRRPDAPQLGARAPQIERMTIRNEENSSSIAKLFQFWTAAYNNAQEHHRAPWRPTWTDRDATEAARFADANLEALEVAILYVILRGTAGGRRIKAFRYYSEEIEAQLPIWSEQDPSLVTIRLLTLRKQAAARFRVPLPTLTPEQNALVQHFGL